MGILGLLTLVAFFYFLFEKQISRRAYLKNISKSGMNEIDKMSGIQFEDYLSILFTKIGFKVMQTKASGDFGADLLLQKDGKIIVVQAKRYQKKVGVKAIQEVHSATSYYNANEAWVVTNNYFTDSAIALAKSNRVSLIDRELLMTMIINRETIKL